MSDFTEMYWTRRDEERERAEREFERWRDAFRYAGKDQPDPLAPPIMHVYRQRCVRCDTIMVEFLQPVEIASLKNAWCESCIAHHIRKLQVDKWKLRYDKPKEGVNQ